MTTPAFNQPGAGGDKFEAAPLLGHLLLIHPKKYVTGIITTFGEKDAVECDIVVLDKIGSDGQPVKLNQTMLFGNFLVGQTKNSVGGDPVLGRLAQKPTDKGNPAWILADHTPEDVQAATAYIASHPAVSQPSAPTPQPDPWAIPATPAAAPTPAATPTATNGWPQGTQGAPPATAAAWQPPAPPAPALDPNLVAYLVGKGMDEGQVRGMTRESAEMAARSFG